MSKSKSETLTIPGILLVLWVLCLLVIGPAAATNDPSRDSSDDTHTGSKSPSVEPTKQKTPTTQKPDLLGSDSELQDDRARQLSEAPVIAEFDAWVQRYLDGSQPDAAQIATGRALSLERHVLYLELIRLAPKAALERAISVETYKRLPVSISENVERPFSVYGDLLVYVVDEIDPTSGKMNGSRTEREVVIGDSRYTAFVYGRRTAMTTKLAIPLRGIILGETMAVDESPVRKLEGQNVETPNGDVIKEGQPGVAAEIGGEVVYFSNATELENFVRLQVAWEAKIGPNRLDGNHQALSPWTEGPKTVLFIRIDFPDQPGEPVDSSGPLTQARAQTIMDTQVNPFFVASSYSKTSLQTTVTPVVRLPQPKTFYEQDNNWGGILTDGRNAARAAGFETNNFNLDIVAFTRIQSLAAAGVGFLGGKGIWLNGSFGPGVIAHELGHNYGLHHANSWRTTDGTVIGQGTDVEYGDSYDTMGSSFALPQFNARYKRSLDWLTDANVQTVVNDGVYRVFAQDSSTPGGISVLKITKDLLKDYWIEFRQLFTANPNAMNGAIVRWDYLSGGLRRTQLLDMTPTTSGDTFDAPLRIGQSFNDNENRIRMTVLGKGNTTPESLDVRVELNIGCSFSLGQTSQSFPPGGGVGVVTVNTQSGCHLHQPTISSGNWLVPTNVETGPGIIAQIYTVAVNNTATTRTGTLTIAGQIFTVPQTACSFSLNQGSQNFSATGGEGSITISTQSGCNPVIATNDSWISVISSNSSTVNYIAEANYGSQSRTGTISVSGQTFTIQQAGAATTCGTQPSGLVAWWRGEGNALDQTGVNNGNVLSGMSYSAGKIGGGFRGLATPSSTNKVMVPDSPSLALDRSLAIEGWLRFDSTGDYTIMVRGDDRDYNGSYGIFLFGGRLWFRVFAAPNGTSTTIISPNGLPTNRFIHFAATLDDATGQLKLYIDGALAAQTVTAIRPYGTLDPTRKPGIAIGNLAHSNLTYDSFNGVIDELSIYSRALLASEVQAIYNAGIAATGAAGKCLAPTIQVTVQSNPAGRSISIDGEAPEIAPQIRNWEPGSSHTISTTSSQAGAAGTQYVWSSWSDGGAISHSVTAGSNTTYTANFSTQYQLTVSAGVGGTVSPASSFFNSGASVQITATPNSGFIFSIWTGTGTGSYSGNNNSATVTVNGPITQAANFGVPGSLRLVLDDPASVPTRVLALDLALWVTEPFVVVHPFNWLNRPPDPNTRLMIFLESFQPVAGEPASAVVLNIVGSNNQIFDVTAEDVRPLAGTHLTQVIFRLPENLAAGVSTIKVRAHNETSNAGTLRTR